jgi:hypothetical protein
MMIRSGFYAGFAMRSRLNIAIMSMLAAGSLAAQAQQGSVSNSRLMFDPNSLGDSRKPGQTAPAAPTTTGQTAQQQPPATRQVVAPQVIAPPPQAAPPAAKPTPKPAPRATAAAPAKPAPARRAAPTERVMNDTIAAQTGSTARPVPREQPNLGRLSLPQGSLGYEGKTQMQTYDMSDGRRVPGFENIQRNDSSYFGLSLRMPTAGSPSSSSSSWSSSSPSSFGNHGAN